jgi:hypothetical protein
MVVTKDSLAGFWQIHAVLGCGGAKVLWDCSGQNTKSTGLETPSFLPSIQKKPAR